MFRVFGSTLYDEVIIEMLNHLELMIIGQKKRIFVPNGKHSRVESSGIDRDDSERALAGRSRN